MAIPVKLQVFEGPLDLLLHLIEKNKVDIYDIPIVTITEQYLEYIKQMETEDMNVVSEFLVMAATLIDIKCRMLLPKEVNEEGEEEDPRAELVQKLLEYKLYKYMSYELKDKQVDAGRSFYKKQTLPDEVADYREPIDYDTLAGDVTLNKLHEIFKFMMKRQEYRIDPIRSQYGKIEKDEINLEEKEQFVTNYIRMQKKVSFRELLEKQGSKMEIIVTFLCVLEMMKVGRVTIEQEELFDDITITASENFDLFSGADGIGIQSEYS
ncbi:MAG: segregation/condensation protein A [Lachnospiraceae bacterium]|nr:segregation/condensation protein A [Lachnospiraceae bacterium]MBR2401745.1 segregation/condensation protein A [Lachnospiraceae bacterium]